MGDPFGLEVGWERQKELLREAEERRIVRALRRFRRGDERPVKVEGVDVRRGLVGDGSAVTDLGRPSEAGHRRGPLHGILKS